MVLKVKSCITLFEGQRSLSLEVLQESVKFCTVKSKLIIQTTQKIFFKKRFLSFRNLQPFTGQMSINWCKDYLHQFNDVIFIPDFEDQRRSPQCKSLGFLYSYICVYHRSWTRTEPPGQCGAKFRSDPMKKKRLITTWEAKSPLKISRLLILADFMLHKFYFFF